MEDKEKSLPVLSWFDEPIKQSVQSVFSGINTAVEALDLFKKYRKAHFSALQEVVGKVKVLGMSSPLKLEDFYYPARVSTDIRRRLYKSEWLTPSSEKSVIRKSFVSTFDGSQYIEKCNKLIVLGGPGAGKTTFLKYLALAYSSKAVFEKTKLKTSKLPFFVPLPDLAKTTDSIFTFVSKILIEREGAYAKDYIQRALKNNLAIVFCDSLDEVPLSVRESVLERIRSFCQTYPGTKIALSCRAADYRDNLESFDEVELVKLTPEAVKRIVRSWFQNDSASSDRLLEVIASDRGISSLTETPLLLSLLCIQFRHDLVLPKRKVDVYKRCIEALLRDWDTSRGFRRQSAYECLSDAHKERLFEHIAGSTLADDKQTYIFQKERLHTITSEYIGKLGMDSADAETVIKEIESHHGIIEQHSVETYCFSHTSIHDYFAARYAISRRIDLSLLKSHAEDEAWADVIIFMCGLHAEPEDIFAFLEKKANFGELKNYPAIERRAKLLFLIYRCLAIGPILDVFRAKQLFEHIVGSVASYARLMANSNIYPLCAYSGSGIRHPYLSIGAKRPSLHSALLPFRKLSNEILTNPVLAYSNCALDTYDKLIGPSLRDNLVPELLDLSIALNLVIPLSRYRKDEVLARLSCIRNKFPAYGWLDNIVDETMAAIASTQP